MKFDMFLSFDRSQQTYLDRVEGVKSYMEARNLKVSFENSACETNIFGRKELYATIDESQCVVVLMSQSFLEDRGDLRR